VAGAAGETGEPLVELLAPQVRVASGSLGARSDDPGHAENLHMVAERRLGDRRVEFAALPLGSVREQPDYPQPQRVG